MADLCYWEAVRAGAEVIDTDFSAFCWGTAHPPLESMLIAFSGTPYAAEMDMGLIAEINGQLKEIKAKYSQYQSKFTGVDTSVLQHQIPGGMLSNMESQLRRDARLRPPAGGARGGLPRARGVRLSPAGDAVQPDRRHAGDDERHPGRALQDRAQGEPRIHARRVRPVPRARGRGDTAEDHRRRGAHHLPPGGPHPPRVGKGQSGDRPLAANDEKC